MKKPLLLLLTFFTFHFGNAQWVSIPDTNFGTWLETQGYSACMQGNNQVGWQMDTTCPAVVSDTIFNCVGAYISDLTGIQYFDGLQNLNCSFNFLTTLPVLPPHLDTLHIANNYFTVLTGLPSSLTYLDCSNNRLLTSITALPASLMNLTCHTDSLTGLPALPASLTILWCDYNQLSNLPALPASLTHLGCAGNSLSSLPALPAGLTGLDCNDNSLTVLPALPASLTFLYCRYNSLTNLPALPSGLIHLRCDENQLTNLPALPSGLIALWCSLNQLTSLPALPSGLYDLLCESNQLTSLPALPAVLDYLDCSGNQLTSLPEFPDSLHDCLIYDNPINCMPRLNYIFHFVFSGTLLTCLPNYGKVIYSSPPLSSLPLCDSANANGCSYCHAFFSVQTDSSNTGIYTGFNESYGSNLTSYLWEFGDGDTSSLPYPSHNYAQPGQYYVCLTASSPECTNTYCDSSFYVFKTEGGLMSALHIIDPATGISEIRNPTFEMFPNPANDVVTISIDESMIGSTVTISDITGRKVLAVPLEARSSQLAAHALANGVYFITISSPAGNATQKFIVSK